MSIFCIKNPAMLRSKYIAKLGNPDEMGYVTKDGIIFSSVEARKKSSKAICLRGLQSSSPHEVLTVSHGNRILYIGKGDYDSAHIPDKYYSMPDIEIEHGHPHDTPLSVSDYYVFLASKVKSLLAYTPDGRYSKITRLPEKKYRFFDKFFQKRAKKKKMELARRNFGYSQASFYKKTNWLYKILEKEYDKDIVAKLEKRTIEYGQAMNVVWEMLAARLGIKYENNLKEKPKFSIFERALNVTLQRKQKN